MNTISDRVSSSDRAALTVEEETTSKIPHKRPIILAVVIVVIIVTTTPTVYFVVSGSNSHKKCLTEACPGYDKPHTTARTTTRQHAHPTSAGNVNGACHNFYEYACAEWMRNRVVPNYRMEVNKFTELEDDLNAKLRELIEASPRDNEPGSYQKVRRFYRSCMDSDKITALGAEPLTSLLDSLGGWPVLGDRAGGNWKSYKFDFEYIWARLRGQYNINTIVSTSIVANDTNSNKYMIMVSVPEFNVPLQIRPRRQKPLSALIPDAIPADFGRKVLLMEELSEKRIAYKEYMIDIATALGSDPSQARQQMTQVLDFETTMAQKAEDAILVNDDVSTTSLSSFDALQYHIDWMKYFRTAMPASVYPPVSYSEPILNLYPSYTRSIDRWIDTVDNRVKANHLIWQLVHKMVPYLGGRFQTIYQRYQYATLGIASAPQWSQCIDQANAIVPFATGKMYVDRYFTSDTKTQAEHMVANLKSAFRGIIDTSTWLEWGDRITAKMKLSVMGVNVGFPDWLRDNSAVDDKSAGLEMSDNEYFVNGWQYLRWLATSELGRIRHPVDKSVWADTSPSVVNAFYDPRKNGIVIPAAILQPPFYNASQPWYANYGGLGMVIGHEITHGFDSNGRLFDENGNLRNWWSARSSYDFDHRANCMVDQYSNYFVPEIGKHVDGDLTLAENIADNGGLKEAYKAFKADNSWTGIKPQGLQNFTDDQLFFLAFSQNWCNVVTPKGADLSVKFEEHSLGRFRVIGPLQNNNEFSRAFNCRQGSYMNPWRKCSVW